MFAHIIDIAVKIQPPLFEYFSVMSPHNLQIEYFQPLHFRCCDHLVERRHKAPPEDIFLESAINRSCLAMCADAADDSDAIGIQ